MISSTLGGIYSVLSLYISNLPFILQLFIHISALILICIISVPASDVKTVLKTSFVFWGVSSLIGGIITSVFSWLGKYFLLGERLYANTTAFELISMILFLTAVSIPLFKKTSNRINAKTSLVRMSFQGRSIQFDALIDSGNLLCDPISGDGIILIKDFKLKEIFSPQQLLAIKSLDVLSENFPMGIRLISTDNGLIPIFRPKYTEVKIFGTKQKREISVLMGIDFTKGSFGGAAGLIPLQYVS